MPATSDVKSSNIPVTGRAGYIGTHICLELLRQGANVAVLDNLSNGNAGALGRVNSLAGRSVAFVEGDLRDRSVVNTLLDDYAITAVIHLAGLKAVGESAQFPLQYYEYNVGGTIILCDAMHAHGVRQVICSSSATVYGDPQFLPLTESHRTVPTNVYGRTKLIIEGL